MGETNEFCAQEVGVIQSETEVFNHAQWKKRREEIYASDGELTGK